MFSPDTVLRRHRDLTRRRHARASRRRSPGRPRTVASIRHLVLRLAAENPSWGYRRITANSLSAAFLCSQAEAILALDFIETATLTGQRQHILATSRRAQVIGATAHPTHAWVTQAVRNLLMDLEDTGHSARIRFVIRDREASTQR